MSLVHTQILEGALLCVIYLGALNDDRVRWQVDTPGQRGSRAQHLEQDKHHSASSRHASRLLFLHDVKFMKQIRQILRNCARL